MTLSKKISYLRKRDGISQEELAEALSVSRQSVYKWENGECLPSMDKIKYLAKMFHVSFDYLMDDSIDQVPTAPQATQMKFAPRPIFFTNTKLEYNQINIDNGWAENRETKMNYRDEYLTNRIQLAKSELAKLNITDIFLVQPLTATFFFYDSNHYTCGFFYAGMIQFICPIENLRGFSYGGGHHTTINSTTTVSSIGFGAGGIQSVGVGQIPTTTAMPDTFAWAVLSYQDGSTVKEFEMDFTVNCLPMSSECKSPTELHLLWITFMKGLQEKLGKLQLKISSLISLGNDIKKGDLQVEEIDYQPIMEANKDLQKQYKQYLTEIEEAKDADIAQKWLHVCLGILLGVVGIIVLLAITGNL